MNIDPLLSYASVYQALINIETKGTKLGTVVVKDDKSDHIEDYAHGDNKTIKKKQKVTDNFELVARKLGELASEQSFCCGGQVDVEEDLVLAFKLEPPLESNTSQNILTPILELESRYVFGISATPNRKDGLAHNFLVDDIYKHNSKRGIEEDEHWDFEDDKEMSDEDYNDENIVMFPVNDLHAEKLEPYCTPATFGDLKSQVTLVDDSVRSALECKEANFRCVDRDLFENAKEYCDPIEWTSKDFYTIEERSSYLQAIQALISHKLCGKDVELVPYKLNVYKKGGFFKPHVDTPTDPEKMIGSLVICFPCSHEGGELVVRHRGLEHVFDFSKSSNVKNSVSWAAFFSDCVHEVKPVKSGSRITMAYSIMVGSQKCELKELPNKYKIFPFEMGPNMKTEYPTVHDLAQTIKTTNGRYLGMFLSHKYTMSAIKPENLKGTDAFLWGLLSQEQTFTLDLLPIAYQHHIEFDEDDGKSVAMKKNVYSMTETDYDRICRRMPSPKSPYTEDVPFVLAHVRGTVVNENIDEGAEHTGNEARPFEAKTIYFHAAIVVTKNSRL